jgi:hypothetical protein
LIYARLSSFVNQYFNTERSTKINEKEENVTDDIPFYSSDNILKEKCVDQKKLCVIAFLDARHNKNSISQFDSGIKIVEDLAKETKKTGRPVTFGWVNATCQHEFSNTFNINSESLPNVVVYVPSKGVYASLVGTFDLDSLNTFISRVIQGRTALNNISKDKLDLKDVKCEEIKDVAEEEEEDDILKEILEEERKKREILEKERELENKGNKKKKKKKSKKGDL